MTFDKEFTTLRELGDKVFTLRGSTLIVEILPDEEIKTAGGIVYATSPVAMKGESVEAHRVKVGKVLMSGQGYWSEGQHFDKDGDLVKEETFEELEAQPGAIILLPQHSYNLISQFPGITRPTNNKLAMVKMDSILAYYPSQEAYETARKAMNANV